MRCIRESQREFPISWGSPKRGSGMTPQLCALPSGGRGNHGNRGSIKEANGVRGQVRRDMSKKWQCRWSDGGEDARVWRVLCEAMVPGRTKCLGENHPSTDESLWWHNMNWEHRWSVKTSAVSPTPPSTLHSPFILTLQYNTILTDQIWQEVTRGPLISTTSSSKHPPCSEPTSTGESTPLAAERRMALIPQMIPIAEMLCSRGVTFSAN